MGRAEAATHARAILSYPAHRSIAPCFRDGVARAMEVREQLTFEKADYFVAEATYASTEEGDPPPEIKHHPL